jgi:hypothetical protein
MEEILERDPKKCQMVQLKSIRRILFALTCLVLAAACTLTSESTSPTAALDIAPKLISGQVLNG